MQRYRVEHETRYGYRVAVAQSWQLAHLKPRPLPWQQVLRHELLIDPEPDERRDETDSFGNTVTHFSLHAPHRSLRVRMNCEVEVGERPVAAAVAAGSWESVRESVGNHPAQEDLLAARLVESTRLVPYSEGATVYAAASFGRGRNWLDAIDDYMHRVHADFAFEAGSTTVSTSVDEVLYQRRGVCQDFAHLMLAGLRGHGLPVRYMSGYLLTDPPPGRPRLLGADASHAWIAAYAPGTGWVEFDPTNDRRADARYITLAWGSDFADAVPLRGVLVGGRRQTMDVRVSVIPQ